MPPTKPLPAALAAEIDRHFAALRVLEKQLAEVNADHERDAKALAERYAHQLGPVETEYKERVRNLKKLIKARAAEIFPDPAADRVETGLGVLLRQRGEKLKTSRRTLALCEKLGFTEVVKVVKSLDRARLARFPREKLALVEAGKRKFTDYGFEVKERC